MPAMTRWIAPTVAASLLLSACIFKKKDDDTDTPIPTDTEDTAPTTTPLDQCSDEAKELVDLLNTWIKDNGENKVKLAPSLCIVGDAHATDLVENSPNEGDCSVFSWSDGGDWTACCRDGTEEDASCTWNKPGEITGYPVNGYEVVATSGGDTSTPSEAFSILIGSEEIADMMLTTGDWNRYDWRALGAGLNGKYASVWFGEERDPAL